jgi:hypothetical protein
VIYQVMQNPEKMHHLTPTAPTGANLFDALDAIDALVVDDERPGEEPGSSMRWTASKRWPSRTSRPAP